MNYGGREGGRRREHVERAVVRGDESWKDVEREKDGAVRRGGEKEYERRKTRKEREERRGSKQDERLKEAGSTR